MWSAEAKYEDNDTDDDELDDQDYVVKRGDSENSSSEDIDGQFGDDDDDGDGIVDIVVTRKEHYNLFIGLGETHSTRIMHDTSYFASADYSLYEPVVSGDDLIAENKTFSSKEHLVFAISQWEMNTQ